MIRPGHTLPGSDYDKVVELAADQHGYVTTSQAREAGVSGDALRKMAKRGTLERVSWGVYRLPTFPPSPYGEYMACGLQVSTASSRTSRPWPSVACPT